MNKIPMLEKFAAQSLVEHNGELIFSKEKFAELVLNECLQIINNPVNYNKYVYTTYDKDQASGVAQALSDKIKEHFKDTQ